MINSGTQNSVETLQTMRLASKQEQTDAEIHAPSQPKNELISDQNKELKQSHQIIKSNKSKKS